MSRLHPHLDLILTQPALPQQLQLLHLRLTRARAVPQAGVHEGKLLSNMGAALSGGGLRSVYSGYLSFMLSNIPYDVAELCTYRRVLLRLGRFPRL